MTETDIECGHTKTTLYARGVNKSCKMITFSHLNSSSFNDNFKNNFMQDKVELILVVLIVSFASFLFFRHLYIWELSQSASFTPLLVAPLICNADSKLNY